MTEKTRQYIMDLIKADLGIARDNAARTLLQQRNLWDAGNNEDLARYKNQEKRAWDVLKEIEQAQKIGRNP